jgi:LuxR family quorum sensing-dependent transcriptional regulator
MSFEGDEYGKRTLDFVERLQQLSAYEDICRHIMTEMEWFGFTCVSSFSMPRPGTTLNDSIWFNNRPKE